MSPKDFQELKRLLFFANTNDLVAAIKETWDDEKIDTLIEELDHEFIGDETPESTH